MGGASEIDSAARPQTGPTSGDAEARDRGRPGLRPGAIRHRMIPPRPPSQHSSTVQPKQRSSARKRHLARTSFTHADAENGARARWPLRWRADRHASGRSPGPTRARAAASSARAAGQWRGGAEDHRRSGPGLCAYTDEPSLLTPHSRRGASTGPAGAGASCVYRPGAHARHRCRRSPGAQRPRLSVPPALRNWSRLRYDRQGERATPPLRCRSR